MTEKAINQTVTHVPLVRADLPPYDVLEPALRDMIATGRITNFGKFVTMFEQRTGEYLKAQTVTTSSGTMGLLFALHELGVERGQKVILPSFTFVATAQAVLFAGGVPVFAEVRNDLTLDPEDLERLLQAHTDVAVVIGVHTYGLPCQVESIQTVVDGAARKQGRRIAVLYDAAHAFGSAVDGRRIGTFGDAEIFSLSATKALVCVEGGLVSSRDADLIHRISRMRNYGMDTNYNAFLPGLNGKMSELHGLIGVENLRRLDDYLAMRQVKARYYYDQIASRTSFALFPWPTGVLHTFKDFTVTTPEPLKERRDDLIAFLKGRGVETRKYFFPPVHEQTFFKEYADRPLPHTEAISRRVLTLPFYTTITEAEMDYVVDGLCEAEMVLA
jgi:dTDP-4-amino-4,6-dideoxygalactose transaminase